MELSREDRKYGWFPYWRCWMKEDSIFSLDSDLNNLWVWCLSKASHTKTKWDFIVKGRGKIYVEILPGQFVCGRHSMAKSLGSNPSTTWKRLKMLESHGFISIKSDKKYSIVTILNWDSYKDTTGIKKQVIEQDIELDREQETRQQRDTKKNVKTLKNDNNVKDKEKYGEFVFLTKDQYERLIDRFGEEGTKDRIENLNEGIGSKGYKYDSHYHTILSWERKNKKKKVEKERGLVI